MATPKLPKAVIMMIEKNNLVMAIKTLADEQNISMEEAKAQIDTYEMALKQKQQQKLASIASKQGIPTAKVGAPNSPVCDKPPTTALLNGKNNNNKTKPSNANSLHTGLDNRLDDLGYKKPLLPYWAKRVAIIIVVMALLFWVLWRVFG